VAVTERLTKIKFPLFRVSEFNLLTIISIPATRPGGIIDQIMAVHLYDPLRLEAFNVGGNVVPGKDILLHLNSVMRLFTLALILLFVRVKHDVTPDLDKDSELQPDTIP